MSLKQKLQPNNRIYSVARNCLSLAKFALNRCKSNSFSDLENLCSRRGQVTGDYTTGPQDPRVHFWCGLIFGAVVGIWVGWNIFAGDLGMAAMGGSRRWSHGVLVPALGRPGMVLGA